MNVYLSFNKQFRLFIHSADVHSHALEMLITVMDLLGVDEAVVTADIRYLYGAVSVGGESG